MAKNISAFVLGFISFFLMFAVGEPCGATAAFITIGIYYLTSQFFLSRGNARALSDDWPIVISLNAVMIFTALLILILEPETKWHAIDVIVSIGSSMIGAGLAALMAKDY